MPLQSFCFIIKPDWEIDNAWNLLSEAGVEPLFSTEEEGKGKEIIGNLPINIDLGSLKKSCPCIDQVAPYTLEEIDWSSQWENHGLDYHDGFVHIDLKNFDAKTALDEWQIVKMVPGPGFGDLSHPTTHLVLSLMGQHIDEKSVLDLGTGSGVLALCSVAMGAKEIFAIDIDPMALDHAAQNAEINHMESKIEFSLPETLKIGKQPLFMLMNMIFSEQRQAWESVAPLHDQIEWCITSGILVSERDSYLEQTTRWGWKLLQEKERDGWLGFHFETRIGGK